jgi:hypothetical protein
MENDQITHRMKKPCLHEHAQREIRLPAPMPYLHAMGSVPPEAVQLWTEVSRVVDENQTGTRYCSIKFSIDCRDHAVMRG